MLTAACEEVILCNMWLNIYCYITFSAKTPQSAALETPANTNISAIRVVRIVCTNNNIFSHLCFSRHGI